MSEKFRFLVHTSFFFTTDNHIIKEALSSGNNGRGKTINSDASSNFKLNNMGAVKKITDYVNQITRGIVNLREDQVQEIIRLAQTGGMGTAKLSNWSASAANGNGDWIYIREIAVDDVILKVAKDQFGTVPSRTSYKYDLEDSADNKLGSIFTNNNNLFD